MGNYETFKVSAWGTTELLEGEEYDRAFERLFPNRLKSFK